MISMTVLALALVMPQDPPPPPPPAPERRGVRTRMMMMGGPGGGALDANGDGFITREEFAAPMNQHFSQMDTDGDGRISTAELQAGGPGGDGEHRVMRFRRGGPEGANGPDGAMIWTREGDGPTIVLDGREIDIETTGGNGNERRMEWTSEDGTQRQVVVIRGDGPMPDMPMPPPPPGAPRGPGAPHIMMMGPLSGHGGPGEHNVQIRRLDGASADQDADGDGKISLQEFTAPMADVFARLDADHSGYLEQGERGGNGRRVQIVTRTQFQADGDGDGDQ